MVSFVLDASALLRFLFRQSGAERMRTLLHACEAGELRLLICAVNWGEVVSQMYKVYGRDAANGLFATFRAYGVEIIAASADRAGRAGMLKRDWKLGYSDAFCVELAQAEADSILVTADYDFKLVDGLVKIDFLPPNSDPTALIQ